MPTFAQYIDIAVKSSTYIHIYDIYIYIFVYKHMAAVSPSTYFWTNHRNYVASPCE